MNLLFLCRRGWLFKRVGGGRLLYYYFLLNSLRINTTKIWYQINRSHMRQSTFKLGQLWDSGTCFLGKLYYFEHTISINILPLVVCRSTHVLFRLYVFVSIYWCAIHIVLCFCFVHLRLVFPMFLVFLYCQFLIAPSVFSNIYILVLIIKKCEKTLMMTMQRETTGICTSWNVCKNSVNKYQAQLFKGFTDIEHVVDL